MNQERHLRKGVAPPPIRGEITPHDGLLTHAATNIPRRNFWGNLMGGFTAIEMIVVIGVTVILTSILIVYSRQGERQVIFFREQSVLVNALLRTKGFSLETFQPALQPGFNPPQEKICGWGVHFEKNGIGAGQTKDNFYLIFRALDTGSDPKACSSILKYNQNQGEEFELFEFDPAVIQLTALCLNSSPGSSCDSTSQGSKNTIDVIFVPPDPKIVFVPQLPNTVEAVIVLELADRSRKSEIRINSAGQVSVK